MSKKSNASDQCCQYFYELWTMTGEKIGAGITIPLKDGMPMPDLKSCILSTLEPEEILKLLNQSQSTT